MKKRLIIFIFMFLFIFFMEVTLNAFIFDSFFSKYWYLEISTIFILIIPILMFRFEKTVIIYTSIIALFLSVMMIINLTLDYASNDIFSFSYLTLASTAQEVLTSDMISISHIIKGLLFILIYVIFIVFIELKYKDSYTRSIHIKSIFISLIVLIFFTTLKTVSFKVIEDDYSKKNVAYKNLSGAEIVSFMSGNLKRSSFISFGYLSYIFGDIGSLYNTSILDIDSDIITKDNKYTGLLQDYNVIEIMVETGIDLAVDKYLTPNLYELTYNGIRFSESYNKNKTNISEYIGIAGSTISPMNTGYNNPYSLPNMLNDKGYITSYFHCNEDSFYNRGDVICGIGFKNTYFFRDIYSEEERPDFCMYGKWNGNYPLDSDFINKVIDNGFINKDNKFYTFWTTLSTHGPYNYGTYNMNIYRERGYYSKIDKAISDGLYKLPLEYDSSFYTSIDEYNEAVKQYRCYMCELIDLDSALGVIINKLKDNNLFDNTVIAIYGDHDLYYSSNNLRPLKTYLYKIEDQYNPIQYKTLMGLYNSTLKEKYISINGNNNYSYFTSSYSIVPTILDLLGVKYDNVNYLNKSIFNVDNNIDNLFYSHELQFLFNNDITLISDTDIKYQKEGLESEYINNVVNMLQNKLLKISNFNKLYKEEYLI